MAPLPTSQGFRRKRPPRIDPCGVSSSFSQTLETEKRQNRSAKSSKVRPSKIMGTAQKPSADLGKPFIAEIRGAPAATATHPNHPNSPEISRDHPNKPKTAATP